MAFILPTIICPACGFDPYDMIFYAVKQEFPDRNPRDVIEEMSDEEYKEEAEFYVFENHIDYCPNQDKLMKISAGFETEEEAFAYAYNQGHAASRKNTAYKPNPTGKDTMDFKKIFKQRAESAGKKSCSDCSQDEEDGYTISTCYDCGEEFCEDCFCSDCDNCDDDCTCKCVECGDKDSYKYELADGGNVCRDCGSRCDECEKTFLRDEVRSNDINHKYYCDECRWEKGECHICEDILIYYENDNGSCEVCQENVCSECSSETEDPEKPGYVGHDVACDNCVKEKKLVVTAETFEAPYAGAGSLMGIGQGTGLGSFTSKELTESSAIHGDFDSASLNYSGKQNLEVRAEADAKQTPFVWCVVRAFDEDDGSGVGEVENTEVLGVFKYKKDADKAMKSVYNEMKSQGLEEDYDKDGFYTDNGFIHTTKSKLGQLWMPYGAYRFWNAESFEADWRDLPRDSAGRWMSWTSFTPTSEEPENLDAYIDIQPAQSGTFPLPVEKQETFSESQITLRELSETMNALTGNLLGFDMAYRTVLDMLGSQDSPERREALLSTMEETIMTLEFYEETDYDGDIQMMVDIMRQNGMNPPPQFEEEVLARYQFEDKWAAEDKKILKPEVPADYNINQTFGNNMVLMSEDDEGPTIEDFFRDISKVLNKYGEFSWDSEAGEEGLYFSGMLLPNNGADNFFQYDEDFSE